MEAMFPNAHRESVRLLVLAGAEVWLPDAQTCCGALHAHAGRRDEARSLARANARAFAAGFDFVVSHSAGCGAALRDATHLCEGDEDVAALAARVRDLSEVLDQLGLDFSRARTLVAAGAGGRALRVTHHDPCHLAHAQKVREAPRRLVRAIPGVEYVELPNADWCCGSAGAYHLTQPELANAQLEQKLDDIDRVAPDVVIASNPGCLLHVRRGLAARGRDLRIAHLAELLGEAFPA